MSEQETVSHQDGLTHDERMVLSALVAAWEGYVALPNNKSDHTADFRRSIHECQRILAVRIVARHYPDVWS